MADDKNAEASTLKDEGNAKFKAGDYSGAIDAYTRSLELNSSQHLCYSNRSAAYLKLGNSSDEALRDAERCIELAPEWAKGYSRVAAALQELNRWDEAIATCEQGIAKSNGEGLQKMIQEVQARRFQSRLQGVWHGRVDEVLGGYDQEMEFLDEQSVRVDVLGRSIVGRYWVDCTPVPHHLNIQVPVQDVPPGMPPPPPVPYIAKVDEEGLHLCCPYLRMERPTDFTGPGYCLMRAGAFPKADDEEVSRLSMDEQILRCSRELLKALPTRKLEDVSPSDSEDAAGEKLMAQVRFQSQMYAVQQRYGEAMKQVLPATRGGPVPDALRGTKEFSELMEGLKRCGVLDEDEQAAASSGAAAAPSAAAEPKASSASTAAASPAEEAARQAAKLRVPTPGEVAPENGATGSNCASIGLAVGLGAVVLVAAVWLSQRARKS